MTRRKKIAYVTALILLGSSWLSMRRGAADKKYQLREAASRLTATAEPISIAITSLERAT